MSESNEPEKIMDFDEDLIRKYPRANRRVEVLVEPFGIRQDQADNNNAQTQFISPHGIEFKTSEQFEEGDLIKVQVSLPNYWSRKQKFVDYTRIDTPGTFKILAKVLRCEGVGKRGRKQLVMCQTLVIDNVDEQVLRTYLQEG